MDCVQVLLDWQLHGNGAARRATVDGGTTTWRGTPEVSNGVPQCRHRAMGALSIRSSKQANSRSCRSIFAWLRPGPSQRTVPGLGRDARERTGRRDGAWERRWPIAPLHYRGHADEDTTSSRRQRRGRAQMSEGFRCFSPSWCSHTLPRPKAVHISSRLHGLDDVFTLERDPGGRSTSEMEAGSRPLADPGQNKIQPRWRPSWWRPSGEVLLQVFCRVLRRYLYFSMLPAPVWARSASPPSIAGGLTAHAHRLVEHLALEG